MNRNGTAALLALAFSVTLTANFVGHITGIELFFIAIFVVHLLCSVRENVVSLISVVCSGLSTGLVHEDKAPLR